MTSPRVRLRSRWSAVIVLTAIAAFVVMAVSGDRVGDPEQARLIVPVSAR